MENTPRLYNTLLQMLRPHRHWLDIRHIHTLLWMVEGLLQSGRIHLSAWVPFVVSRAQYAQSTVRRFSRWLHNERIQANDLWGPIIQAALQEWGQQKIYLALDTTVLWERFCHIRLAVIYRGRAIPLVWKTLAHSSSSVAFEVYQDLLDLAAQRLPQDAQVILLADRGFADTQLLRYLHDTLHWHYRIRIKANFLVYRPGKRPLKAGRIHLKSGQALFWKGVFLTRQRYGPVSLALANPWGTAENWYLVSDEPAGQDTFVEYGLRFDIEEGFLDDKSNGFQIEASRLRSAGALSRLYLVLAVATLFLLKQGVEVVEQGRRRCVDAHWFRGQSYLKIGWNWIRRALVRGEALVNSLVLPPGPDPEPAQASKPQTRKRKRKRLFRFKSVVFA